MAHDLSEEAIRKFEKEVESLQKDLSQFETMRSLVKNNALPEDSHQLRHAGEVVSNRLKDRSLSEDAKQFAWKRLELMHDPTDANAKKELFALFKKYGLNDLAGNYAVEPEPIVPSPRNRTESPRNSPRSGFLSRVGSKLAGFISPRSRKSERPAASDEDSTESVGTPRFGVRPD
ncbi:MAG TPA: hypothetical protein VGV92_01435 [Gammaproteobacteria bacterium]|nr:hypothetical protein [Gammaproteobacteria bacterium]